MQVMLSAILFLITRILLLSAVSASSGSGSLLKSCKRRIKENIISIPDPHYQETEDIIHYQETEDILSIPDPHYQETEDIIFTPDPHYQETEDIIFTPDPHYEDLNVIYYSNDEELFSSIFNINKEIESSPNGSSKRFQLVK